MESKEKYTDRQPREEIIKTNRKDRISTKIETSMSKKLSGEPLELQKEQNTRVL